MLIDSLCDNELNISTECKENDGKNEKKGFNDYEPTSYYFLEKIFLSFPFKTDDHLVDFGCGKGRVLFMAAYHGCRHVTGCEINEKMFHILKKNKLSYQEKFGENAIIDIFLEDAQKMSISKDMNKFFFFNPVYLINHIRIINRIIESLKDNERKIEIYLYRPHASIVRYHESIRFFNNELYTKYIFETRRMVRSETPQVIVYSNYPIENIDNAYSMYF